MSNLKYQRIVLKISGEALSGSWRFGINPKVIKAITSKVARVYRTGVQIAIVVGGGNMWRGVTGEKLGMERSRADYIGMLATVMNGIALQDGLKKRGIPTRIQTSVQISQIAEPYVREKALSHLNHGRIVIFAGGIGNPYFSTDTTAVLRAAEINADAILMAKNGVDGVYSDDPKKNPQAVMYHHLTYLDLIKRGLKVMDMTAISLAMENQIPLVVFNFKRAENVAQIIKGHVLGTLID